VAEIAAVEVPPSAVLMQMADPLVSRAIHVAAALGIAKALGAGPRTVGDLAASTGAHAGSLHRSVRALASVGVFTEDPDGPFGLTPLAEPPRWEAPDTIRPSLYVTGDVAGPTVADLEYELADVAVVVDVGGGHGGLVLPLLAARPQLRGIVVDLPHAASGARAQIEAGGLADRCEFVAATSWRPCRAASRTC
jgi:hypothetical protein